VRSIFSARWQRDGSWFTFDVVGNAFLRGMVRSLVGTMVQIGLGGWPAGQMAAILSARDRALAAPPAPACGLCLMQVDYE
jgi:tRNA pseudouridine38-40 synthase